MDEQQHKQYTQHFVWGFAAEARKKLMLTADPDREFVDLRYWSVTLNTKTYRTNQGILIPKKCLTALVSQLEEAQNVALGDLHTPDTARTTILGPKPDSIEDVGEQTYFALWTWVPPTIEKESRSINMELWEVDKDNTGYWELKTFVIPPHEIEGLIQALRPIVIGKQNSDTGHSDPDNRT